MARVRAFVWLGSIACLVALGCYTQRRPITGRDLDPKQVDDIVVNQTAKQQVLDRFGKPDSETQKADGSEEIVYTYRGYIEKNTELLVYAKKDTITERKVLRIVIRGGMVTEVAYTNSENPSENVSK